MSSNFVEYCSYLLPEQDSFSSWNIEELIKGENKKKSHSLLSEKWTIELRKRFIYRFKEFFISLL